MFNNRAGEVSQQHGYFSARKIHALKNYSFTNDENLKSLRALAAAGIHIPEHVVREMIRIQYDHAMDSIQPTVTTQSIPTPNQFLQAWAPGLVYVQTSPRKIDLLIGQVILGEWRSTEIIQPVMELTGSAVPYGDYTNTPLSSWNMNFERRSVVRFEEGMRVGNLEEATAAAIRANSGDLKRKAAGRALEIIRNKVGFYGYNDGTNRTYGFLNDPGLPAYTTFPNGASMSPLWSTKTFIEITADIRGMFATLQTQSDDLIDPQTTPITLALATAVYQYLTVTQLNTGLTVRDWIKDNYPTTRIVTAPQLNAANGGANVAYLYADRVDDDSTDDGRTIDQNIQTKFLLLGVQKEIKAYLEAYTNATAGVMVKRSWAIVRRSGC